MPAKPRKRSPPPEYVRTAAEFADGIDDPNESEPSEDGTTIVPQPKTSYRVHPQGRDTYCTPQVIQIATRLHAAGLSLPVLCKAIGLSFATAQDWNRQGRADLAAGRDSPFARWWTGLEEAKGACEANLVRLVSAGAVSDWKAAAFLLERRYPQRWGKPEHRLPKDVKDDLSKLSTEDLRKVASGQELPKLAATAPEHDDDVEELEDEDELTDEDDSKPPPIDV